MDPDHPRPKHFLFLHWAPITRVTLTVRSKSKGSKCNSFLSLYRDHLDLISNNPRNPSQATSSPPPLSPSLVVRVAQPTSSSRSTRDKPDASSAASTVHLQLPKRTAHPRTPAAGAVPVPGVCSIPRRRGAPARGCPTSCPCAPTLERLAALKPTLLFDAPAGGPRRRRAIPRRCQRQDQQLPRRLPVLPSPLPFPSLSSLFSLLYRNRGRPRALLLPDRAAVLRVRRLHRFPVLLVVSIKIGSNGTEKRNPVRLIFNKVVHSGPYV